MTAQQLRNSILQMAVQGKLVPQDPTDEPASVLLERIRAEKEKLIKEGKIKREKNPSVIFRGADNLPYEKIDDQQPICIADEVPFEIPESWEWVKLPAIGISELGKTLDKGKNTGSPRPYLCSINVYWNGIDLTQVKTALFTDEELSKYALQTGDVLVCEGGDVGRTAIWHDNRPMYYQNALHRVRFFGGMLPEFFVMLMECYKGLQILDNYSKGMTIKHLVQSSLKDIIFPLPPIKEQERVVERLNQLKPYIEFYDVKDSSLQKLNCLFPSELKKSILQMAVQGKLVPQDPTDEPAEALLVRIREQKEQLIRDGKIKRDKHESVIYRRDNSHYEKMDGIERCIDDEIPYEIPESWTWARLNQISKSVSDGDHQPPPQVKDGVPFVVISNVSGGTINLDGVRHVPHDYFVSLDDKRVAQRNDILYTVTGSYGIPIAVDIDVPFCFQRHIALIKPLIDKDYLFTVMASPMFKLQADQSATGIAQKTVGIKSLSNMLLPIPPSAEQIRINRELEKFLGKLVYLI